MPKPTTKWTPASGASVDTDSLIVDELGNFLVDESGNFCQAGTITYTPSRQTTAWEDS